MKMKTILAYGTAAGAVVSPIVMLGNDLLQDWVRQLTAFAIAAYLLLPIILDQPSCYSNFWPCIEKIPELLYRLWELLTDWG